MKFTVKNEVEIHEHEFDKEIPDQIKKMLVLPIDGSVFVDNDGYLIHRYEASMGSHSHTCRDKIRKATTEDRDAINVLDRIYTVLQRREEQRDKWRRQS